MAIKVTNGFEVRSKNPIDTRLTLSKEQMRNMNDKLMPETYFALCTDDNELYVYVKSSEPNADTGKFVYYNKSLVDAIDHLDDITVKRDEMLSKADIDEICK